MLMTNIIPKYLKYFGFIILFATIDQVRAIFIQDSFCLTMMVKEQGRQHHTP